MTETNGDLPDGMVWCVVVYNDHFEMHDIKKLFCTRAEAEEYKNEAIKFSPNCAVIDCANVEMIESQWIKKRSHEFAGMFSAIRRRG